MLQHAFLGVASARFVIVIVMTAPPSAPHLVLLPPRAGPPYVPPTPDFCEPRQITSADEELEGIRASLIGAVKALSRSPESVSEHWYMWCCKFGKTTPANRTPVLDPTQYNFDMRNGILTYWTDHVQKPRGLCAIEDAALGSLCVPAIDLIDSGESDNPNAALRRSDAPAIEVSDLNRDAARGRLSSDAPSFPHGIPHIWHVMCPSWDGVDISCRCR